jgi:hypothetical protein
MNGFTTVGLTPELQAMMDGEWSEPVQVRARRAPNGALDLEFRHPFAPVPPTKPKGAPRAADH